MITRVRTRAYANIALVKYWGKREGPGNLPATPSISLALEKLLTETEITRSPEGTDSIIMNGEEADEQSRKRLEIYIDRWRTTGLIEGFFDISTRNSFPAKAGLASSSSGFAALALALGAFSSRKIDTRELTRLARTGSGSAARSVTGGLSAFPVGKDPAARLLEPADKIPWGMVIVTAGEEEKSVSSREGMELSRRFSPYYRQWVAQAKKDYRDMLSAAKRMDFTEVGTIAEANALAMHACMIATRPSLIYWKDTTIRLIHMVEKWREGGLSTYFTIDAGHHVALLGRLDDLDDIASEAVKVRGVHDVMSSRPAGGAEVISCE